MKIKQGHVSNMLWPVLGIHLFNNYLLSAHLDLRHCAIVRKFTINIDLLPSSFPLALKKLLVQ